MTTAVLFASPSGPYVGRAGFDVYTPERDAFTYTGGLPVIAHPPCARWTGRWHGMGSHRHTPMTMGDDKGAFSFCIETVRRVGGVIEHPAHSLAWMYYGISEPTGLMEWQPCAWPHENAWTLECHQHDFGHLAGKPTWLYWFSPDNIGPPPNLTPRPNPRPPRKVSGLSAPQRERTPLPFLRELEKLAQASRVEEIA